MRCRHPERITFTDLSMGFENDLLGQLGKFFRLAQPILGKALRPPTPRPPQSGISLIMGCFEHPGAMAITRIALPALSSAARGKLMPTTRLATDT